jgi:hypothetical protein
MHKHNISDSRGPMTENSPSVLVAPESTGQASDNENGTKDGKSWVKLCGEDDGRGRRRR